MEPNEIKRKWLDFTITNPGDEYSPNYEERRKKIRMIADITLFSFLIIGLGIYVGVSYFYNEYWASLWVLILLGPIFASFIVSLIHGRMSEFAYPLLCVALFCSIGYIYQNWHPMWAIFLSIPVYYFIGYFIDRIIRKKK